MVVTGLEGLKTEERELLSLSIAGSSASEVAAREGLDSGADCVGDDDHVSASLIALFS